MDHGFEYPGSYSLPHFGVCAVSWIMTRTLANILGLDLFLFDMRSPGKSNLELSLGANGLLWKHKREHVFHYSKGGF